MWYIYFFFFFEEFDLSEKILEDIEQLNWKFVSIYYSMNFWMLTKMTRKFKLLGFLKIKK